MLTTRGKAFILGDNIDTDQILPGYAMSYPKDKLKEAALAGSAIPDFANLAQAGDVIIGGENFGCGSSREQAPIALKGHNIAGIIAKNFAMIFRKNSINIGLPVITCDCIDDIKNDYTQGDVMVLDIENATLKNETKDITYSLNKLNGSAMETIKAGGLMEKVKKRLGIS